MNKLYLTDHVDAFKKIELNYEFESNSDGQDLKVMNEVIRKFKEGVRILKENETPEKSTKE